MSITKKGNMYIAKHNGRVAIAPSIRLAIAALRGNYMAAMERGIELEGEARDFYELVGETTRITCF